MKIVIIGQWTYPDQRPRAQRTWQLGLQFAKEGHDVTVYALLGGETDYSGVEEKYGLKVRNLGVSPNGLKDSEGHRRKTLHSSAVKILLNEYNVFPGCDFRRMVRETLEREAEIDLLISVACPHAIHWAVARYIDRTKVKKWVADCGDPFMLNPFGKKRRYLEKTERRWCERCDFITVPVEQAIDSYYPEYRDKIRVIPQGFDLDEVVLPEYTVNSVPTFVFAGRGYSGLRDPANFLRYLSSGKREFRFLVYTNTPEFFPGESVPDRMSVRGFIPRSELLCELAKADFLVNIVNPSTVQSPSKLIDYALSGRPILDISSVFPAEEQQVFEQFLDGNYEKAHKVVGLERFDIRNVARSFLELAR